jgi:polyisoprenyl-teichoic acid--peptidoglycan teichoic acid transferase
MTRRARAAQARRTASDDTEAFEAWRRGERLDEWEGRRRRRRWRSIRRTIVLVLLVTVVGVVVGSILLGMRAAAFNDRVSSASFLSSSLLWPLNGEDRVNVLLVGYGGGTHDGTYLADSVNILSIDPTTDTTTTIPIPRDFWIEGFAELPNNAKVNEVFAIGEQQGGLEDAGRLLADLLSGATGLPIEHWMAIDFAGFAEMVDAVGGVTVNNPVAFSYTQNEQLHQSGVWTDGSFPAGAIELDGDAALAYVRARYTNVVSESSDFARLVRQQRVIAALRTKLGSGGIGSLARGLAVMNALEGRLTTDLSTIDLFLLSGNIDSDHRIELTEGPVLTATTNTDGQYILIPVGWTGPGAYGSLHSYLATELAKPIPTAVPSGAP